MFFSVQPLCSLCLCGSTLAKEIHHRGTETQRVHEESRIRTPPTCRMMSCLLLRKGGRAPQRNGPSQDHHGSKILTKRVSVIKCPPIKETSPWRCCLVSLAHASSHHSANINSTCLCLLWTPRFSAMLPSRRQLLREFKLFTRA